MITLSDIGTRTFSQWCRLVTDNPLMFSDEKPGMCGTIQNAIKMDRIFKAYIKEDEKKWFIAAKKKNEKRPSN